MMSGRRINILLWTAAAALCAGALALAVVGIAVPVSVNSGEAIARSRAATTQAALIKGAGAEGLEAVVSARWRRELSDVAAPVAVATTTPVERSSESLPMTLVGTVGSSLAMLQAADGNVEVTAVGESAGGMKVLAVRRSQVDVEYNGRKMTLERPKETGGVP
jgi:hypothetical protein